MFTVKRMEVNCIKNRHGRPAYGKEVRWYVMQGDTVYTDKYGCKIWCSRKCDALEECDRLVKEGM